MLTQIPHRKQITEAKQNKKSCVLNRCSQLWDKDGALMTVTKASFRWGYFIKIWVGYFKIQVEINLVRINQLNLDTTNASYTKFIDIELWFRPLNQLFVNSYFSACFALLISSFTEATFYHEQRTNTLNNFASQHLHVFVLIRKATH